MQYYPHAGIQVTQRIDETLIDFDSSRYRPKVEETEQITKNAEIKDRLVWNFESLGSGHIRCYFNNIFGPGLANEGAKLMTDYIFGCAVAGP